MDEAARPASMSGHHHALGFLISAAFRQMRQIMSKRLAAYSLTPPQCGVLLMIMEGRSPTLSEVARSLMGDVPTVCRIVDRLERRGFVQRDKDEADRRCLVMRLTAQGHKVAEEALEVAREIEALLVQSLADEEAETLRSLLRRMLTTAAALAASDAEPSAAPAFSSHEEDQDTR